MGKYKVYYQPDSKDCGPTCIQIIAKYFGKYVSIQRLREASDINREGVSMLGLSEAARTVGLKTTGVRITMEQLSYDMPLPCIFLMNSLIGIVFSTGTFVVFGSILAIYNWQIFLVFIIGNAIYILWILLFMRYRKELDNKMFSLSSRLQNNMVQFVEGMPEIKLNNLERVKLWEWKNHTSRDVQGKPSCTEIGTDSAIRFCSIFHSY